MILFRFSFAPRAIRPIFAAALSLSCLLLLAATPALAQDDPTDVVKVDTSLVQLNVGVVDRQGRAVMNLSRGDFKVYEDDVLQPLTDFEPATTPFSLVLLLDMSGSTQTFRPTLKQ